MKKVFLTLIFLTVAFSSINAQQSVNNYKYVIVPEKFDFLKENDQYQLNSLTKFLLEKENFEVYIDNNTKPADLAENRCLSLFTRVSEHSKLFKTKIKVELVDCNNNIIVASEMGETREKVYKLAYHEALRNAFESIKELNLNYAYSPVKQEKQLLTKEELKAAVKEEPKITPVVVPKTEKKSTPKVGVNEQVKIENPKVEVKEIVEIEKPKTAIIAAPVVVDKIPEKKPKEEIMVVVESYLRATPTSYGYSVSNNANSKESFDLVKTGKKDVYFFKGENAIVYKSDSGLWKKETFSNSKIVIETLDLRF